MQINFQYAIKLAVAKLRNANGSQELHLMQFVSNYTNKIVAFGFDSRFFFTELLPRIANISIIPLIHFICCKFA